MPNLVGQRIGKYRLLNLLGRGGTAEVYRARHPELERFVAVKILHPHLADDPGLVRRFELEANAIARLRHARIVQVFDFAVEDERAYMVMELLEGPSLHSELRERRLRQRPLQWAEVAQLGLNLAEAIDYAHGHDIIHRYLKPSNILFSADGQAMLSDFGLARRIGDTRRTETGLAVGTPAYMSPEQARGERSDHRSDIYTLGVILYELTTGHLPFEAEHTPAMLLQIIQEPPIPPTERRPDLPPAAGRVLLQALQKELSARPTTAGQLAQALAEALSCPLTVGAPLHLVCPPPVFRDPTPHELADAAGLATQQWLQTPPVATPPSISAIPQLRISSLITPTSPFQVPAEVPYFVGRDPLLKAVTAALLNPEGSCVALCGLGGIGKTALAGHLAYRLRGKFPDGILWSHAAKTDPLAHLNAWARAYGYDFSGLTDLESRAAAVRNLLVDKQVLIVIDDVWDAAVARALLPGGSRHAVLLTMRNADLAVALNAQVFTLPWLNPEEARQMLARIVGLERVAREAAAAAEIAQQLMYHPLALEIAARRLVSRPRWQLAELAERLRDEHHRLDELAIGDKAVRASFTTSWEALDPALRRTFSHLAIFEGRPFTAPALAAVGQLDKRQAADHLGLLAALSWVGEEGTVHYRQHPLLADFAREQLHLDAAATAAGEICAADYYLAFAQKRSRSYLELEAEWDNIAAGLRLAHRHAQWATVLSYAAALAEAWFTRGFFADARQGYAWVGEAARAMQQPAALAHALCQWGRACVEQSDYTEAEQHLTEALDLSRRLADPAASGNALYQLGRLAIEQARYAEAEQWLHECQELRTTLNDPRGLAEVLVRRARIRYYSDDYAASKALLEQGLALQEAVGDVPGSIRTLNQLADTYYQQDELERCEACCLQAIERCERLQDQNELGSLLETLSATLRRQGKLPAAREHAERSVRLFQRTGNRRSLAVALYNFSRIEAELGQMEAAIQAGQESVDLCQQLGDRWGLVYILLHVGDLQAQQQRPAEANAQWQAALQLAQSFSAPTHPQLAAIQERLIPGRAS